MKWLARWFTRRPPARCAVPPRFIPQLEQLERREVLTVTYNGGGVLPHVEVQALYYGSDWYYGTNSNSTSKFETYLSYLVNSPYMDMLTSAGYGVGRGTWNQGTISIANLPYGSTLLDSTIRSTIQSYITSGNLQNPDAERLYVVYVQDNVVVYDDTHGGSSEPGGFVGYHSSFSGTDHNGFGATIHYAIVVTPGVVNGVSSSLPTFDQMTSITSHEVAEAVTDPTSHSWYDTSTGNEIGDVFANDYVFLNHYIVQIEADQNETPIAPVAETFEAGEFPGSGVWRYSSFNGWRQLTTADAFTVDVDANGDVIAAFSGSGLWRYEDSRGWQELTTATPSLVAMSGNGIVAAEFSGQGVWRYEDRYGWQQLNQANASQIGVDLYGNVVAEFPGYGVWRYTDFTAWRQLTSADASQVAIGDNGEVAAEFNGQGVWRYEDATGWQQLTTANASSVGVDALGDVAAEFSGSGVWRFKDTTNWVQLTSADAAGLATGALGDVIAEYSGNGLWVYDDANGWEQITSASAPVFAIGA